MMPPPSLWLGSPLDLWRALVGRTPVTIRVHCLARDTEAVISRLTERGYHYLFTEPIPTSPSPRRTTWRRVPAVEVRVELSFGLVPSGYVGELDQVAVHTHQMLADEGIVADIVGVLGPTTGGRIWRAESRFFRDRTAFDAWLEQRARHSGAHQGRLVVVTSSEPQARRHWDALLADCPYPYDIRETKPPLVRFGDVLAAAGLRWRVLIVVAAAALIVGFTVRWTFPLGGFPQEDPLQYGLRIILLLIGVAIVVGVRERLQRVLTRQTPTLKARLVTAVAFFAGLGGYILADAAHMSGPGSFITSLVIIAGAWFALALIVDPRRRVRRFPLGVGVGASTLLAVATVPSHFASSTLGLPLRSVDLGWGAGLILMAPAFLAGVGVLILAAGYAWVARRSQTFGVAAAMLMAFLLALVCVLQGILATDTEVRTARACAPATWRTEFIATDVWLRPHDPAGAHLPAGDYRVIDGRDLTMIVLLPPTLDGLGDVRVVRAEHYDVGPARTPPFATACPRLDDASEAPTTPHRGL